MRRNLIRRAMGSYIRLGRISLNVAETVSVHDTPKPAKDAQECHNGHSLKTLAWTDRTWSKGTMQSLFGLYLTTLFEHSEPPRWIISDSKFVRAIDVTNWNKQRKVGCCIRLWRLCAIFVMFSIDLPIASDSFVED